MTPDKGSPLGGIYGGYTDLGGGYTQGMRDPSGGGGRRDPNPASPRAPAENEPRSSSGRDPVYGAPDYGGAQGTEEFSEMRGIPRWALYAAAAVALYLVVK